MADTEEEAKKDLIGMLNRALELEHAAFVQYLAHAEIIEGLTAEPIMARLRELAEDEEKHQEKFRTLIADYLGGVPSMGIAETHPAKGTEEILRVNLKDEMDAVVYYSTILDKVREYKQFLPYAFWTLEHEVRHVIIDEQEHIAELKVLLGMS